MIEILDEIKKIRGCYESDAFYYDVVNGVYLQLNYFFNIGIFKVKLEQ